MGIDAFVFIDIIEYKTSHAFVQSLSLTLIQNNNAINTYPICQENL